MNKTFAAFRGTVRRLVLRIMVHVSENLWINAESRLIAAELAHEKTTKQLARCRSLANDTRGAHFRWQLRLSQNNYYTTSSKTPRPNGTPTK